MLHALREAPQFEVHAKNQAKAVKSLLNNIKKNLSADDFTEVANLISDVGFPEDVQSMLLAETERSKEAFSLSKDCVLQQWESFIHDGTKHFWQQVLVSSRMNTHSFNTLLPICCPWAFVIQAVPPIV